MLRNESGSKISFCWFPPLFGGDSKHMWLNHRGRRLKCLFLCFFKKQMVGCWSFDDWMLRFLCPPWISSCQRTGEGGRTFADQLSKTLLSPSPSICSWVLRNNSGDFDRNCAYNKYTFPPFPLHFPPLFSFFLFTSLFSRLLLRQQIEGDFQNK